MIQNKENNIIKNTKKKCMNHKQDIDIKIQKNLLKWYQYVEKEEQKN